MKLLLHICCAPCAIYPLGRLKKLGYDVAGFFYNPNIHPQSEYENRRQAAEKFAQSAALEVIYPPYQTQDFFQAVNAKEPAPQRCLACWALRLKAAAKAAQQKGFNSFSTTLLVSPYQDQAAIKEIGNRAGKEEGIEFYYEDFRPGFRVGHQQAKQAGLYCQKYCGCLYSERERCQASAKP